MSAASQRRASISKGLSAPKARRGLPGAPGEARQLPPVRPGWQDRMTAVLGMGGGSYQVIQSGLPHYIGRPILYSVPSYTQGGTVR